MSAAATMFPDDVIVAKNRENTLTVAERQELAASVVGLCKTMGRDAADRLELAGRHFEAEEFEAEAMLAAVQAAREWQPDRGTKFSTFAVAFINQHFAGVTDRRYQVSLAEMEFPDHFPQREADEDAGDEPGTREPNADQLRLLNTLPEPTRSVVRLCVFDGFTPDMIAKQLHMAPKDVKLVIRNAGHRLTGVDEHGIQVEQAVDETWAKVARDIAAYEGGTTDAA